MPADFQAAAQQLLSEVDPRARLVEVARLAARPGTSADYLRLRIDAEYAVREISIPSSLADAVAGGLPEAFLDLRDRLRQGLAARGNRLGEPQADC
ncbi:MAG: hypothetical protein ACRD1E_07885 [Terriglobales bacterium]